MDVIDAILNLSNVVKMRRGPKVKQLTGFQLTKGISPLKHCNTGYKKLFNEKKKKHQHSPPEKIYASVSKFSQRQADNATVQGSHPCKPDKDEDPNIFHGTASNRMLNFPTLRDGIQTKLVCKQCATLAMKQNLCEFGNFVKNKFIQKRSNVDKMADLTEQFLEKKQQQQK